jgi:hypothetical protein
MNDTTSRFRPRAPRLRSSTAINCPVSLSSRSSSALAVLWSQWRLAAGLIAVRDGENLSQVNPQYHARTERYRTVATRTWSNHANPTRRDWGLLSLLHSTCNVSTSNLRALPQRGRACTETGDACPVRDPCPSRLDLSGARPRSASDARPRRWPRVGGTPAALECTRAIFAPHSVLIKQSPNWAVSCQEPTHAPQQTTCTDMRKSARGRFSMTLMSADPLECAGEDDIVRFAEAFNGGRPRLVLGSPHGIFGR